MRPIRLLTYSTLFPNAIEPNHGIFVENRLSKLLATGEVDATVVAPVPYFPSRNPYFGSWSRRARVPAFERRGRFAVYHPRFPVIPKVGAGLAPWLLYQATIRPLARLLAAGSGFDLIDAHYFYPDGVAAVLLGRRFGLPVVVTARGSDITLFSRQLVPRQWLRRAIGRADGLVAVSGALKDGLMSLGAPGSVEVLRNGVDTDLFRPHDRAAARAALLLTRPTLISVGLLIERKGHHRTIQAMTLLPEHELIIVGEGPERARLEALIARLGLADRVRLLGSRPHAELPHYYAAADALVLASSREGWANVLLEAMACGTPVIASPIPGNPEVVQNPDAGLIAKANTPQAIAAAVRALRLTPRARAATRAYAEQFSWDATTQGQVRLFRRVLDSRAKAAARRTDLRTASV
ncbi:MAG: glycosyltransferase [Acetobacteraceae bacterium]|nr:glycosyltransferase [Acetobacteraceae bacterium]